MDSKLLSAMDNLNFTAEEAEALISDSPPDDENSGSWLVGSVITPKPINGDSVIRVFRSPYNPILTIEDYDFQLMTIWIRVYRLPLRAMNREMGLRLGSSVGTALGVDHRIEGGNMGEFLRILVQVDIRKPLRQCVLLGATLADLENKQLQYGGWLRVQTQQPRPDPRRRTGIEYFSETASGSTESSSTNAPIVDAQAPTTAPAPFSSAGTDTAQEPHVTKATTDDTDVTAATPEMDGTEPAATEFSASNKTESANVLGPVEGGTSSQAVEDNIAAHLSNVSVRSSKRAIQGRYEYNLSDGGCRGVRATPSSIMKTVYWNCRGLENSSIVRFLGDFVAQHTPALIFLCETRLRNSSSSRIKTSLGMEGCFTVDFGNGCNGLMLLWNNDINVNLLSYSANHIDATVDSPTSSFRFTGFHVYYTESMKHLNWSLFDRLRQASSLPWLIGGDFNELLCHSEKEGGRCKPRGLIDNF
ncbi:hypothetical protein GQ457_16G014750 [Hibiscus cannabinus]